MKWVYDKDVYYLQSCSIFFIDELGREINKLGKGVKCGNRNLSLLCFADDIVLIGDNRADLESMLQVSFDFSLKWRLKYNYDKCAVVVFDGIERELKVGSCTGKCQCTHHFTFGPNLIQETLSYKYLGVELDNRLSFREFKSVFLPRLDKI